MIEDNFEEKKAELKKLATNIQTIIATLAITEFKRNFNRQAFFTEKWKLRKSEPDRATLIKTGRLRRSINFQLKGDVIEFISDTDYAKKHNEGLRQIEYVKAGTVKKHSRKMKTTKGLKNITIERHQRQAHSRKVKTEKRQFVGYHIDLEKALLNEIEIMFNRILK